MARDPADRGREVFLGLVGRIPFPGGESPMAGGAGERGVDRVLKGDMIMAFEAGLGRGGLAGLGGGGGGKGRHRAEDDDPEPSLIQDSQPSVQTVAPKELTFSARGA